MLRIHLLAFEAKSKIEITKYVSPVCLPEDASEDFGDGTFAIATGWGREASTNGNQLFDR